MGLSPVSVLKKPQQNSEYLKNKKSFKDEIKITISIIFKTLIAANKTKFLEGTNWTLNQTSRNTFQTIFSKWSTKLFWHICTKSYKKIGSNFFG